MTKKERRADGFFKISLTKILAFLIIFAFVVVSFYLSVSLGGDRGLFNFNSLQGIVFLLLSWPAIALYYLITNSTLFPYGMGIALLFILEGVYIYILSCLAVFLISTRSKRN